MEVVTIESQAYKNIVSQIEELVLKIKADKTKPENAIIDNQEFLKLMKVSKRTAQTWRDEGLISFSQIGNKIYYKLADIENLLNKYHKPAFAKNGK